MNKETLKISAPMAESPLLSAVLIRKFSDNKLRKLKRKVDNEISRRSALKINSPIRGRFYGVVKEFFKNDISLLQNLTEAEFLKYRRVSEKTLRVAKKELEVLGLSFKNSG